MISIRAAAPLHLSPRQVWALFRDMERHYLAWHPDHLGWEDVRGRATEPGSVVFADERVGRLRLRARFHIDEVVPERRFSFHLGFPFNLLRAGGSFLLEPAEGGCVLVAETHLGPRGRLAARLVDPVLEWLLPPPVLEAHLRDEGARLERLGGAPRAAPAPRASRAVTAHVQLVVARPPAEVFDFLADLRNEPAYNPQVRDVTLTSAGPVGLGSTFAGRHGGFGRVSWELSSFERPRRLVIDGVVAGGRYRWVAELQARGAGTQLLGRMAWELPRWLRSLRPFLQLALGWSARRSFRRFQAVLEGTSAPVTRA